VGAAVGKLRKGWAETTAKPTAGEDKGRRKINTAGIEKRMCTQEKHRNMYLFFFLKNTLISTENALNIFRGLAGYRWVTFHNINPTLKYLCTEHYRDFIKILLGRNPILYNKILPHHSFGAILVLHNYRQVFGESADRV